MYTHVTFITCILSHATKVPDIYRDSFVYEFNEGFTTAFRNLETYDDIDTMEDIYLQSRSNLIGLGVGVGASDMSKINKLVIIINSRLKMIRKLR
jgi:hypothetical protein